jgi:predicted membrane protein
MIKYDDSPEVNEPSSTRNTNKNVDSRTFIGVIFVAIGGLLLARNYGWLDWIDYDIFRHLFSWPMLLIVIGLFQLARRAYTPAIVLIGVGLLFLFDFSDWENLWPAILILVGASFILQWRKSPHQKHFKNLGTAQGSSTDFIDETAIFGGRNLSIVSENFQGGKITSIFGGSKINLRYSKPAPGCTIDVANIFGGTKIIVPEDWNIKVEVVSIFGGFEDKRGPSVISRTSSGKVVVIKGTCIFGGGEINTMP